MKYTYPLCDQNAERYCVNGDGTHKEPLGFKGLSSMANRGALANTCSNTR
jgi:hypothetical protein